MVNYEMLLAKDYAETKLKAIRESGINILKLYQINMNGERINEISEKLLKDLYEFLDNCGFFDNLIASVNSEPTSAIKQIYDYLLDSSNAQMRERKNDILLQKKDLVEQFKPENQTSKGELYANLIQLLTFSTRFINANAGWLKRMVRINDVDLSNANKKLRSMCMREILKCKKEGENISIEYKDKTSESLGSFLFYIHDRQYFEPFYCTDCGVKKDVLDKSQYTTLGYVRVNKNGELNTLHLSIPFRVSEEKRKILEYIIGNMEDRKLANTTALAKTVWYAGQENIKKEVKNIDKKTPTKPKNSAIFPETPTQPAISSIPETPTNTEPQKKLTEQDRMKLRNEKFWQEIYKKITGEEIYSSLCNVLTWRTSYEIQETYNKIKENLISTLEAQNIPQDKIEVEAYKLFLYLKLAYPMSKINIKAFTENEFTEILNEAASVYDIAIDVIQNNDEIRQEGLKRNDLSRILTTEIEKRKSEELNKNRTQVEELPEKIEGTKKTETKENFAEKNSNTEELETNRIGMETLPEDGSKKIDEHIVEEAASNNAELSQNTVETIKTSKKPESAKNNRKEGYIEHKPNNEEENKNDSDEHIVELVKTIKELNKYIEKLNASIEKTCKEVKNAEMELNKAKDEYAEAQARCNAASLVFSKKTEELNTKTAELNEERKELERVVKAVERVKEELFS